MNRCSKVYLMKLPRIIYGSEAKGNNTSLAVQRAVKYGYSAIDTANCCAYNEILVGDALIDLYSQGYKRGGLWLQSKFTFTYDTTNPRQGKPDDWLAPNHDTDIAVRAQVWQSFNSTLEHLHTEYLDSLILHAPYHISNYYFTPQGVNLSEQDLEAWEAMEDMHDRGLVRSLGVSNFSPKQLELLIQRARIKPSYIQNMAYGFDSSAAIDETLEICKQYGIEYQGPHDGISVYKGYLVRELAEQYNISSKQMEMKLAMQRGISPLVGTANSEHMRENVDVLKIDDIKDADVERIYELGHLQMIAYEELYNNADTNYSPDIEALELSKKFTHYSQLSYLILFGVSKVKEALDFKHDDIVIKTKSGHKALKILCKEVDGFRVPTSVDAELANKFLLQEQIYALEALGNSNAGIAVKITSYIGGEVLKILCDDVGEATEEQIVIANEIIKGYGQLYALRTFGAEHIDTIVKIGGDVDKSVVEVLCQDGDGYKLPTEADIATINRFNNKYIQSLSLKKLGKSKVELALKLEGFYSAEALKILCDDVGEATEEQIAIANKFTANSQYEALRLYGKEKIDFALKFNNVFAEDFLRALCKNDAGELREPTDKEVAWINKCGDINSVRKLPVSGGKEVLDTSNIDTEIECDKAFTSCDSSISQQQICSIKKKISSRQDCLENFVSVSQELAPLGWGKLSDTQGRCFFSITSPTSAEVCDLLQSKVSANFLFHTDEL